jgi:hypothetical protein
MPTSVLIPPSPQKNFPGYVFVSWGRNVCRCVYACIYVVSRVYKEGEGDSRNTYIWSDTAKMLRKAEQGTTILWHIILEPIIILFLLWDSCIHTHVGEREIQVVSCGPVL